MLALSVAAGLAAPAQHFFSTAARPSRAAVLAAREGSCAFRDPALWHCRPDKPLDSCRSHTGVSSVNEDGEVKVSSFAQVKDPPVDCFIVHGTTASNDEEAEDFATWTVAAPYIQACRVFAPARRVEHVPHFERIEEFVSYSVGVFSPEMTAAYEDVRDAFDYYLQHHNQGRGFLLVGHQQGAAYLARLLQKVIEPDPLIYVRFVSAHLFGASINMAVPAVAGVPNPLVTVGGAFVKSPPCTAQWQTQCVIGWGAYAGTPHSATVPVFAMSFDADLALICTDVMFPPAPPVTLASGVVSHREEPMGLWPNLDFSRPVPPVRPPLAPHCATPGNCTLVNASGLGPLAPAATNHSSLGSGVFGPYDEPSTVPAASGRACCRPDDFGAQVRITTPFIEAPGAYAVEGCASGVLNYLRVTPAALGCSDVREVAVQAMLRATAVGLKDSQAIAVEEGSVWELAERFEEVRHEPWETRVARLQGGTLNLGLHAQDVALGLGRLVKLARAQVHKYVHTDPRSGEGQIPQPPNLAATAAYDAARAAGKTPAEAAVEAAASGAAASVGKTPEEVAAASAAASAATQRALDAGATPGAAAAAGAAAGGALIAGKSAAEATALGDSVGAATDRGIGVNAAGNPTASLLAQPQQLPPPRGSRVDTDAASVRAAVESGVRTALEGRRLAGSSRAARSPAAARAVRLEAPSQALQPQDFSAAGLRNAAQAAQDPKALSKGLAGEELPFAGVADRLSKEVDAAKAVAQKQLAEADAQAREALGLPRRPVLGLPAWEGERARLRLADARGSASGRRAEQQWLEAAPVGEVEVLFGGAPGHRDGGSVFARFNGTVGLAASFKRDEIYVADAENGCVRVMRWFTRQDCGHGPGTRARPWPHLGPVGTGVMYDDYYYTRYAEVDTLYGACGWKADPAENATAARAAQSRSAVARLFAPPPLPDVPSTGTPAAYAAPGPAMWDAAQEAARLYAEDFTRQRAQVDALLPNATGNHTPVNTSAGTLMLQRPTGLDVWADDLFVADAGAHAIFSLRLGLPENSTNATSVTETAAAFASAAVVSTEVDGNQPNETRPCPAPPPPMPPPPPLPQLPVLQSTVIAGTGAPGYREAAPGTPAQLHTPTALCFESRFKGLYVADTGNHCVRHLVLDQRGVAVRSSAVAGVCGPTPGLLHSPRSLAWDDVHNVLYIADTGHDCVRRMEPGLMRNGVMLPGRLVTFYGDCRGPSPLLLPMGLMIEQHPTLPDLPGRPHGELLRQPPVSRWYLYIADSGNQRVLRLDNNEPTIDVKGAAVHSRPKVIAASTNSLFRGAPSGRSPGGNAAGRNAAELNAPSGLALAPTRDRQLIAADGPIVRKITWSEAQFVNDPETGGSTKEGESPFADGLFDQWSPQLESNWLGIDNDVRRTRL